MKKMIFAALVAILAAKIFATPAAAEVADRAVARVEIVDHAAVAARATGLVSLAVACSATRQRDLDVAASATSAAKAAKASVTAAFPGHGEAATVPADSAVLAALEAVRMTFKMADIRILDKEERCLAIVGAANWALVAAQAAGLAGDPRAEHLWEFAVIIGELACAAERQDSKAFQAASKRLERLAK